MMKFNKANFIINLIWIILVMIFLLAFNYVCIGSAAGFMNWGSILIFVPLFIIVGSFDDQREHKFNNIIFLMLMILSLLWLIGSYFMQLQSRHLPIVSWHWLAFVVLSIAFIAFVIVFLNLWMKIKNKN